MVTFGVHMFSQRVSAHGIQPALRLLLFPDLFHERLKQGDKNGRHHRQVDGHQVELRIVVASVPRRIMQDGVYVLTGCTGCLVARHRALWHI